MRVVHLVPYFQPQYTGGMQRYVASLCREQRLLGVDASILTLRLGRTGGNANCVSEVPTGGRDALFVWQRTPVHPLFPADVRRAEADVIHLHSPSPSMEAALLLANRRTSSLVVTLHNGLPRMTRLQQSLGHLAQMMLKRVVRRSKAVIAPHDVFAESAFGWLEVNDRLHIVPPGVDHTRFRSLGMERDDDEVLFVGHVRPEKGLHVLVEALVRLPKRRLKVMASVSYEAKYFRAIRARAEAVLGPRVAFTSIHQSRTWRQPTTGQLVWLFLPWIWSRGI